MSIKTSDYQEAREKLLWLREMYSNHHSDDLFIFDISLVLQNDTSTLSPVLKADKIKISDWYNRSLYIKCYNKGDSVNEKAISFEIIAKVAEMMEESL